MKHDEIFVIGEVIAYGIYVEYKWNAFLSLVRYFLRLLGNFALIIVAVVPI